MGRKGQVGTYIFRGYRMVYQPTHSRAQHNGYVREHIVIVERALGKSLPSGALVHHANGNGTDNQHENLVVCENAAYHHLLHQRLAAYRATGNANLRQCVWCSQYGDPANPADGMTLRKRSDRANGNGQVYHRACATAYQAGRRA